MTTQAKLMTAEELFNMPDDGYRYELLRGELIKMAPAEGFHGKTAMRISVPLGNHVYQNGLGEVYAAETGYRLAHDHVLAPDVSFISSQRLDAIGEGPGYWPAAPDLVVEVISPSDRLARVNEKARDWLNAGTRMAIIVNPRRRDVTVHYPDREPVTLTEEDTLYGGDVVPGWELPVRNIFSRRPSVS